jgi:murein DD-endopeptidase / murein LD-carboxypeptidase
MCRETICLPVTPLDRARCALGTRFRLHGRDPASGLDCVGLIAFVYCRRDAPTGYALRGGSGEGWAALLDGFATRRQCGAAKAGDIMLLHAGPAQYHLGLWTGSSLIHADAGLGHVVELPGWPVWPVVGLWHTT